MADSDELVQIVVYDDMRKSIDRWLRLSHLHLFLIPESDPPTYAVGILDNHPNWQK